MGCKRNTPTLHPSGYPFIQMPGIEGIWIHGLYEWTRIRAAQRRTCSDKCKTCSKAAASRFRTELRTFDVKDTYVFKCFLSEARPDCQQESKACV